MELKNGELEYSQCNMYKLNYSEVMKSYPESILDRDLTEVTPCTDGWMYEMDTYKNTVVTEVLVYIFLFFY